MKHTVRLQKSGFMANHKEDIMRIGLIDVDGHRYPNLCLMKLSAYHKARGDTVD